MADTSQSVPLKLNLGSGQNPLSGHVNVDKFGSPDVKWDLEEFPWPWPDNSVDAVVLHHVLEHLGETTRTFFGILKELYRVCKNGAVIDITVPHPRHDNFLSDPTHVRAFTADSFTFYSKEMNRMWKKNGNANSPLGLYLDIDFKISHLRFDLAHPWAAQFDAGQITHEQLMEAAQKFNNVVTQINVRWVVNKLPA